MRRTLPLLVVVLATGCCLLCKFPGLGRKPPPLCPPSWSSFEQPGWGWQGVGRVLVLPFLNESPYTRADEELQVSFTAAFQQAGRYELVAGPPDDCAALAATVHRSGRFDEALMLKVGAATRADVIVHGVITHYSPYPRPRLGVVFQVVSPSLGRVVASVDGLWDSTDRCVADRCRAYYRQRPHTRPAFVRNNVIAREYDAFAEDLSLESPALFQRFVCHEAISVLLGLPVCGVTAPFPDAGAAPAPAPTPAQ